MSGGIEDVDAVAVILELEDGRSDGDTSLLLYLHPVGYGVAGGLLALYGTGEIYRAAVEQEFFCQCSFTGVGVRDYRERPALFYLFGQCTQVVSSVYSAICNSYMPVFGDTV